ncbi:MAG: S49 family peptidase [Magnetococcales bacterium]|nr:S49 family peptidase [Magnetococcales bacterium]
MHDLPPPETYTIHDIEDERQAERMALLTLFRENLKEHRRTRWGRYIFRVVMVSLFLVFLLITQLRHFEGVELESLSGSGHTAMVDVIGPIMPGAPTSAENITLGLQSAFADKQTKGVILRLNSPGGSPVQSGIIYDEMVRLQKKHPKTPLYVVMEDTCASGCYYIAAAAKELYADKATMVGSIGVIMRGFGLEEAIKKLGVESRVLTSGKNKAFLDPFSALKGEEKARAEQLLGKIHKQFIKAVKQGRGRKLKGRDDALFNGMIWTGEEAVSLGLVDALGSYQMVARDIIKNKTIVNFSYKNDWLDELSRKLVDSALQHSPLSGGGAVGSWSVQ